LALELHIIHNSSQTRSRSVQHVADTKLTAPFYGTVR